MRRREFIVGLCSASACSKAAFAQRASEGRQYRISYLALAPGEDGTLMNDFSERLRELGLVRGHNLTLVYRSAEGRPERLSHLANELLESHPDVLVAGFGTLAAKAAKEATTTVPVIFGDVGDPVGAGLVASLNRPGGNVTGLRGRLEKVSLCPRCVIQARDVDRAEPRPDGPP